ncbi:hypothetical protein C8Q73DRAFT_331747 [Cubamyces lactineus]|nr:hypothetical protein C8Q73DRAFT_331747 [Cubamyces lactineus]
MSRLTTAFLASISGAGCGMVRAEDALGAITAYLQITVSKSYFGSNQSPDKLPLHQASDVQAAHGGDCVVAPSLSEE